MAALAEVHCRASDADRDRAVRALQRGLVEGRLSYDSFIDRVEVALRAREGAELADVLTGLPGGPGQWLRARWRRLATRWADAPLDPLQLPGRARPALLIGRDPGCDLVLGDPAVSRRHASLMFFSSGWFVLDHGSTNGTWVNDRQILGEAAVRPGDRLRLGRTLFRLVPGPS